MVDIGKSWYEVRLLFELRLFFDIVDYDIEIKVAGKILKPDMKIPSLNLIIEYDGSCWHENKFQRDCWKRRQLERVGYQVCRIREEPLPLTNKNWDISLPRHSSVRSCVIALVNHIINKYPEHKIDTQLLSKYKTDITLNNGERARIYREATLRKYRKINPSVIRDIVPQDILEQWADEIEANMKATWKEKHDPGFDVVQVLLDEFEEKARAKQQRQKLMDTAALILDNIDDPNDWMLQLLKRKPNVEL